MKLKIVSDGTPYHTTVVNAATGEPIENVIRIKWSADACDLLTLAELTVLAPMVEFECTAPVIKRFHPTYE